MSHGGATIAGLSDTDSAVLKLLCEDYITRDGLDNDGDAVAAQARATGITDAAYAESVQQLRELGYIRVSGGLGATDVPLDVTHFGFERYLWAYRADYYDNLTARVAREIVARDTGHGTVNRDTLAEVLTEPKAVIAHILEQLNMVGKIKAEASRHSRNFMVLSVSVSLKRESGEAAAN